MKHPRAAIVQLCRAGDCVNAIPIAYHLHKQGYAVDWHVHSDFADILEPCSYIKPVLVTTTHRDVNGTADRAAASGLYDKIVVTQVDGNKTPPPTDTENFIAQAWGRAGLLDKFHDIPLVFDRRDITGEQRALNQHLPPSKLPYLMFCLKGHSSPFWADYGKADDSAAQFETWLRNKFCKRYQMIDLGGLELQRSHHLLAFLERAALLVTIDTLPLHLAYATGTPTIALSRGGVPWYKSEPRRHWIGHFEYQDANGPKARLAIHDQVMARDFVPGRLVRSPERMERERIFQVIDWWLPAKEGDPDRKRILNARRTWEELCGKDRAWSLIWHETPKHATRTSKDIGDPKTLPYINDIISFGCQAARDAGRPDGIVVFCNSDVGITPEAANAIREKMKTMPCCYSRRIDLPSIPDRMPMREDIANLKAHVGADLFAFRASWWESHKDEIPLMFLSMEGWDAVARWFCKRHTLEPEITPPVVWHVRHDSYWSRSDVIHTNPAQLHNRRVAAEYMRSIGLDDSIYPDGKFLFRADGKFDASGLKAALA